jgi:hypothetical protein
MCRTLGKEHRCPQHRQVTVRNDAAERSRLGALGIDVDPLVVPGLSDGAMSRLPGYSPAEHDCGVRAVFAFPLAWTPADFPAHPSGCRFQEPSRPEPALAIRVEV